MQYDLLKTVEAGGCSAKLSAEQLAEVLADLPKNKHERLLVDIDTHDDAGVYKLSDDTALIQTTDFFPPVCSDPYDFGQIAAANSLSDVYAMGGTPITALNLVMFPSEKIPLAVLKEILKGGMEKVSEAKAVICGGHTINDYPPKYGLAVTGIIHPDKIITNDKAKAGDKLILTKPLGTGIIMGAKKLGLVSDEHYLNAVNCMKQLNDKGAEIMQKYNVCNATDITGFGLLGHAMKMAKAANVTIEIDLNKIPVLPGVYDFADQGCIPGATFRNQKFIEDKCSLEKEYDFNRFMIACDAQTSGGLLISADKKNAESMVNDLRSTEYKYSSIIGTISRFKKNSLKIK